MKKCLCTLLLLAGAALLGGCAAPADGPEAASVPEIPAESPVPSGPVVIDLNTAADDAVNLTAAGSYRLTGVLRGRVTVDADGPVELILDGAGIYGPEALRVLSSDPVTVVTADGTVNTLSDGGDPDAAAAVSSKAPLTLTGAGTLNIVAGVNNGVAGKAELTVAGGTVNVNTANNGLKAKGALSVTGGDLRVVSGGDGLAAEADRLGGGDVVLTGGQIYLQAESRGIDGENLVSLNADVVLEAARDGIRADSFALEGGTLSIVSGEDGIQTVTALDIRGGVLDITSGGGGGDAVSHPGESFGPWGGQSSTASDPGGKGLKSDGNIAIAGGVITLDTADDSVHCGGVFTMDAGALTLRSSDDGIHADDMLVVNGGALDVQDCFEGLEAFAVEIHGGDVVIRAVNDGINANGAEMMFGGSSSFESVSGAATTYFLMSGGTLDLAVTGTMSNMGDGIDSNGAVYITGGELVVSTFGSFMENGLDTGWGGPVVTGGKVIAGGSSTMAESFSDYSTQCCAVVSTSYMPDGTRVTITDEDGNELWSVVLQDGFSCLQVSHPDMTEGHVYTLTYGDQSTTLDFTSTTNIENSRGFGGPGGRPF